MAKSSAPWAELHANSRRRPPKFSWRYQRTTRHLEGRHARGRAVRPRNDKSRSCPDSMARWRGSPPSSDWSRRSTGAAHPAAPNVPVAAAPSVAFARDPCLRRAIGIKAHDSPGTRDAMARLGTSTMPSAFATPSHARGGVSGGIFGLDSSADRLGLTRRKNVAENRARRDWTGAGSCRQRLVTCIRPQNRGWSSSRRAWRREDKPAGRWNGHEDAESRLGILMPTARRCCSPMLRPGSSAPAHADGAARSAASSRPDGRPMERLGADPTRIRRRDRPHARAIAHTRSARNPAPSSTRMPVTSSVRAGAPRTGVSCSTCRAMSSAARP